MADATENVADTEGPQDAETGPETPDEEAKRKFREALERKRGPQSGASGGGKNSSKVRGTHAAAGGKKMFRRKAGG